MIAFSWYLLKVMIGSGILFAYYLLALRNRPHHRWNRFYLLTMTAASLVLPLLRFSFPWEVPAASGSTQWVQLLRVVNDNEHFMENANSSGLYAGISWLTIAYLLFSAMLMARMILPYVRMRSTIRATEVEQLNGFNLVHTQDEQAPFTLFNYIFWNRRLDLDAPAARQVLEHEMVHVRERHSLDKLFLNLTLVLCWPVPFFWLIRRELGMVHEFIADAGSIPGQDTSHFAAMILQVAYPGHPLDLTSSFFQSPIKRRLLMLMKNHSRNAGRIGRWMALPLIIITSAAFVLRPTPIDPVKGSNAPKKKVIVVIDAGHGGKDNGAMGENGALEKNIALQVANRVKALNTNDSLVIVLTRSTDEFVDLKERTSIAKRNKADLFLSLHLNAATEKKESTKGMDLYVSANNKANEKPSQLFGSLLHKDLMNVYEVSPELKTRTTQGIWVLDDPDAHYAAALVQLGYITNDHDRRFMESPENQTVVAKAILRTLYTYTEGTENLVALNPQTSSLNGKVQPLFVLDGKELPLTTTMEDLDKLIKPTEIAKMDVLKGDHATKKYGSKGDNGVIEVTSIKKAAEIQ